MSDLCQTGEEVFDDERSPERSLAKLIFDGVLYYFLFLGFGLGCVFFLVGAFVASAGRSALRRAQVNRYVIHLGARLFFWVVGTIGVVRVIRTGARGDIVPRPSIVVANHPSMLDAFLILSEVPQAVCVMKRTLLALPVIASFARRAGYVWQENPDQVIRDAGERLRQGCSIVLFPEGTRSPSGGLGEIKRGVAHLAIETGAPLAVVAIKMNPVILGRNRPWWVPPRFPVEYRLDKVSTLEVESERLPAEGELAGFEGRKRVISLAKELEETLRSSL